MINLDVLQKALAASGPITRRKNAGTSVSEQGVTLGYAAPRIPGGGPQRIHIVKKTDPSVITETTTGHFTFYVEDRHLVGNARVHNQDFMEGDVYFIAADKRGTLCLGPATLEPKRNTYGLCAETTIQDDILSYPGWDEDRLYKAEKYLVIVT